MFGGPGRPRVAPGPPSDDPRLGGKASESVAGDFSTCPTFRRPASSIANQIGGSAPSSAGDPQTSPSPCGIPRNRLYGTGTHSNPLEHQYHADEVPPSSSVVATTLSMATPHRYQQLAAQHLYGAANSSTAGVPAPCPSAPAADSCSAAAGTVPSSILRYTDPRVRPLPSAQGSSCLLSGAKQDSGGGGPAPDNRIVSSSGPNSGVKEGCSEANELSTQEKLAVIDGTALSSSSAHERGDQPTSAMRRAASAHEACQLSPKLSRSSTAAPLSSVAVAATADDRARSRGSATRREQQQRLQRQRTPWFPSRTATPARSTSSKHLPPPRTAQWAVKLIEDFVAQVAVQQESAAMAPTIVPLYGATSALGRKETASGRDATTTTTVADLTATFLSSRYGMLQWRRILHEFAACLHRYRRLSPTCAVFREYFIHVDTENLGDFYLFCRLYAASDIQHCSRVETQRVAFVTETADNAHTIVSRRYVDEREVPDRLQRMLQYVVLMDCSPRLVVGVDSGAVSRTASGSVSTSRRPSGCVQYRYARDPSACVKEVPQRRHLTDDEVRRVKRAVLDWMEEAICKCTRERSYGAVESHEDDGAEEDARCETAGGDLLRISFDREGWVDAYALLQTTLEVVKLACRARHPSPQRRDEDASQAGDGACGFERNEDASDRSQRLLQQWRLAGSSARRPPLQRELVPPPPHTHSYPLEEVTPPRSRPQHRSPVQCSIRPTGEDEDGAEAPYVTQKRQAPSYMQPRTSVFTGTSATRGSADGCLWSPSREWVTSRRHRASTGQRTSSRSPRRRVAAAEERRQNPPASQMQEQGQSNRERKADESRLRSSYDESFFAAHEGPYHHHPYVAQLHGNQLWAEAQKEAAAASKQRGSCWGDYYPRIYSRVHGTPSPRKPAHEPCAAQNTFAFSTSSVDATIDSIDAELHRPQARVRDDGLSDPLQMTAHSVDRSPRAFPAPEMLFFTNRQETRCTARSTDGLPLPPSFSLIAPPVSTVAYPGRVHPIAVRSLGSTAPAARAIRVVDSTPAGSTLPILSPCAMSCTTAAKEPVASAAPHSSHEAAAAVTSNTVLLTDEEQAMLDELEIALHRLDTRRRRDSATITAAAGDAPAAAKAYA
ncbi:hypothetical protein MNV84_04420 [Leishmania braziliensis]|nr:hypothetical protein MNV84_04420 [Leishmania braziliensis]